MLYLLSGDLQGAHRYKSLGMSFQYRHLYQSGMGPMVSVFPNYSKEESKVRLKMRQAGGFTRRKRRGAAVAFRGSV